MPLSPAQPRTPLHHRGVTCHGYHREDGLWDLEAHLVDTKAYPFESEDRGGLVQPGEALHEMWLRVTIDDDLVIHRVEAVTDHAPFRPCAAIAPAFAALAGLRIGAGFNRALRERFSGVHGCTHIVELFGPIATTAYQTLHALRERKAQAAPTRERPKLIDTCHALSADGEVVRRLWPQFHTGDG